MYEAINVTKRVRRQLTVVRTLTIPPHSTHAQKHRIKLMFEGLKLMMALILLIILFEDARLGAMDNGLAMSLLLVVAALLSHAVVQIHRLRNFFPASVRRAKHMNEMVSDLASDERGQADIPPDMRDEHHRFLKLMDEFQESVDFFVNDRGRIVRQEIALVEQIFMDLVWLHTFYRMKRNGYSEGSVNAK